ncbi:MAG: DtxR family transcriptional regulator, Mn-dependent transcriptional regulator [Archaeoglobi archaeon]|nr:metal-dependent transcriptional regulator [Candidatus Mnemosynella sp.]MBC7115340.1 metal-dependent transcriptional regulator [Candidatus Mnemosynella bozhongmuii]MDI3502673.1 DtxR family transcriptional regulator, Mn-dependent transcriptional regulator [Archaeoglobi archaeon]MDK2782187.1 DtxR family transcriptional regulator, Mn-dependent transcriptional regulator [Archaeoglobi archaeon]
MKFEDYLIAIHRLEREKGYARNKDIAKTLGVSASTVSEMLRKLDEEGYVTFEKYFGAKLTEKGREFVRFLRERRRIIFEFLLSLGAERELAEEQACLMEHVIKTEVLELMKKNIESSQERSQ